MKRLKLKREELVLFLLNLGLTFLFYTKYLNEDNCNYAIEEIYTYNSNLFCNSINIAGVNYSPRYCANMCMSVFMHIIGSDWFDAALFLIRFNYILYAAAITFLTVKIISRNRLLAGVILNISVMSGTLISLGFGLSGAADVFLGTGIPLALIGITCILGEKKQWFFAWIFCSLAGFMHVHEGMWSGCIVGIAWLAGCIADRKIDWKAVRGLPIYVISICLIVLPNLLHSGQVDENYFTTIYAFIRTPHHLLLSAWGWEKILRCGFLLFIPVGILISSYRKDRANDEKQRRMTVAIFMAVLWLVLLGIEYFATEIHSMSFIITMYVPKCFKFLTFLGMAAYAYLGFEHLERREYIKSLCLIGMLLVPNTESSNRNFAVCICLLGLYLFECRFDLEKRIFKQEYKEYHTICKLLLYLLFTSMAGAASHMAGSLWLICCIIFVIEFLNPYIKQEVVFTGFLYVSLTAVLLTAVNGRVFHINRSGIRYITGTEYVRKAAGDEVYELAQAFKESTDTDIEFLADPMSSSANYFQLISERTCYCLYKNTPSSKSAVIEWYERILETEDMISYHAGELRDLMNRIGVEYILVTADKGKELDASGLFKDVVKNEVLAVYRLAE